MFLHKRGKTWYLHFTDSQGKRQKISTKTSNRLEAEKVKKRFSISSEYSSEKDSFYILPSASSINLISFKKRIVEYAKLNFTKANMELYERVLRYLIEIIGNKVVSCVSIVDVEKYKANRVNKVSKTTVNIELRTLRAIFNIAVQKWDIITKNPAKNIQQLSIPEKEILSLTNDETYRLLDVMDDYRFKKIVLFAFHTGCRASEIINLEWSDVDLNNRVITIRNKPTFKTKTGKIRQIPINDILLRLFIKNNSNIINVNRLTNLTELSCVDCPNITFNVAKFLQHNRNRKK